MGDNLTFKKGVCGYIPCYIVYHGDYIVDYIQIYEDIKEKTYYKVSSRCFKSLDEAKNYIIDIFKNIPA